MLRSWLTVRRYVWLMAFLAGCSLLDRNLPSPTAAGVPSQEVLDVRAQAEGERAGYAAELHSLADQVRPRVQHPGLRPRKSVLALSGGGCYGAYSAGVLYGWSQQGTRPTFDVVTGISTGSLIAPLVFLGSKYDEEIRRFYTTLESKDIYQLQILRGLFTESLASNEPLSRQADTVLTDQVVREIAEEHRKGRRLYIGTTERDSRRFVVWDIGAIACRDQPDDRATIKAILLGSAAIPGFFPASRVPITIDGQQYLERHIDGSTSAIVFIRPPVDRAHAECQQCNPLDRYADTDLYIIVAGKLYADPTMLAPRALQIAVTSISTTAYAQTRADLQRLHFIAAMTGMDYHLTAIPQEFPAPLVNTDFRSAVMTPMFNEGIRQVQAGTVWRRMPPGVLPGEKPQERSGTDLTRVRSAPQVCPPE